MLHQSAGAHPQTSRSGTGIARLGQAVATLSRPVARWARPRRSAATGRQPQPAAPAPRSGTLLSVVVPIYRVELYLAECLDSVLAQTHRDLEVVLVDDGSPDGSYDIARSYVERDDRFRLVRQPNAGLSAARNAGAAVATGDYLTFLDSDDRLAPDAYELLVGSLERSGSDFAVGCYRRFDSTRRWPAARWVRDAHAATRTRLTLDEHPAALVNAVAWSKVYRRSFYVEQGLRFPPGVLYEDQAVSAAAYARARRFDVLSAVTHEWRVREDASSISQQMTDPEDLRARFAAAHDSLAVLTAEAGPVAVRARRTQLLSNDFPASILRVPQAGTAFWELLVQELRRLAGPADDALWADVPVGARAMSHLVLHADRDALVDFLDAEGHELRTLRTRAAGGTVVAELPLPDSVPAPVRERLGVLAPSQTRLVTSVRRVRWSGPGTLDVDAWAYVDHVDLSGERPDLRVLLRERGTGTEIALTPEPVDDPDVVRVSRLQHCDLRRAPFRVRVDVDELLRHSGRSSDWAVEVHVEVAGLSRSDGLRGLERSGSAGDLRAQVQPSGARVLPVHVPGTGLVLEVRRPALVADEVELTGRTLTCRLQVRAGEEPRTVLARHSRSGAVCTGTVVRDRPADDGEPPAGGDRWTVRLELDAADDPDPSVDAAWGLRVAGESGRERAVAWLPSPVERLPATGPSPLSVLRSRAGNLTLRASRDVVLVQAVAVLPDGLQVDVLLRGVVPGVPTFSLRGTRLGVEPRSVEETAGGALRLVFPLEADEWGFGAAPLPLGDYLLLATRPAADGGVVQVPTEIEPQATAALPVAWTVGRLRGRLERQAPGQLRVRVDRPLRDDERGAFWQRRLQDAYATSPARPERAVLFRTYYGEVAADSALAVHTELRRRGAPVTLYWAVRDASVLVPEGGVPVVHESAQWYDVLRDATYVVDNMHQPPYFRKREHQVLVATMHGYPFKSMGHPHWERLGFSRARVRSFDERAAQWDHLVSPASYATPLLRRDFRYEGSVLEIGYPRNDLLLQEERAAQVRAVTRRRLGLAPSAQAVLYAPTFRDALSTDDHRAPMVDYLDAERLLAGLGDDVVLLVRGHAFNARMPTRLERQGRVVDVTDYPFVNDLYLAADLLVADYSSLRFDFALTGKPMVFLVPDLAQYRDDGRGWLFDFALTAPGPHVATTDEVVEALRDPEALRRRYADAYARFRRDFLDLEDGAAAARLVDAVLAPRGDA